MKTSLLLAAATALAALTGCASPPPAMNYGHPALNAAAVQPTVIVVQQPVYVQAPPPAAAYERPGRASAGQAIAGGLVGGLIGSAVGKGEGRVAAAALGAGLGTWLAVKD